VGVPGRRLCRRRALSRHHVGCQPLGRSGTS
jgi:hypothetical protein